MAKMTAIKAKTKESVKVIHNVERVNLYEFGYEKAGSVKGDPDIYAAYLERIVNGDLVEDNYSGFSDEEKKERLKQIKALEKELKERESNNAKIEVEVKEKEKGIEEYREEILKMNELKNQDHEKLKDETFSTLKFSINLFLLVFLSIYLFFFYISAAYKALYVDFEGIAERIASGEGTGSIMPGAYELVEALQFNYLLLLVPVVFFAFGWAFHILLELKNKAKVVFLSMLIAVTFIVDYLLAMIIHNNTESAKALMGMETVHYSQSSTFYIILFLGFLVYVIWSILLHSLLKEWDKKQVTRNLKKVIKHLEEDIRKLKLDMKNITEIKAEIANYREDINTVFYGNLKKYIDQFSSGWLSYLSPSNMKDMKETCLQVKKTVEENYDIQKGVVRVISRRA
jgi:cation transport ATPase